MNPNSGGINGSAIKTSGFAIVPSDTTDLPTFTSGIFVTAAGTLSADLVDGGNFAFGSLPIGFYPLGLRRVRSTGTTATIIGLY